MLIPLLGLVFLTGLGMDAWWHLHYAIGFALIPLVALKLASTGYRAASYYAGRAGYRRAGPPHLVLRLMAPLLVLAMAVALASGVLMWAEHTRGGVLSTLHTDSAVVAAGTVGVHVIAYLPGAVRPAITSVRRVAGSGPVLIGLVLVSVAMGTALALATYPSATWPARHEAAQPAVHGRR